MNDHYDKYMDSIIRDQEDRRDAIKESRDKEHEDMLRKLNGQLPTIYT